MLNEVNQVLKYTCVSNQVLARRVLKFMFYPLEALTCSEYGLVGSGPEHRSLSSIRLVPIRRHFGSSPLLPLCPNLRLGSAWTVVRGWLAGSTQREEGERLRAWVLHRLLQHRHLALGRGRQLLVHCLDPYLPLHVLGQRRVVKGTPHVLRLHAQAAGGPQPAVGQTLRLSTRPPLFAHL